MQNTVWCLYAINCTVLAIAWYENETSSGNKTKSEVAL